MSLFSLVPARQQLVAQQLTFRQAKKKNQMVIKQGSLLVVWRC